MLLLGLCSLSPAGPITPKQAEAAVTGWLSRDRMPLGETLGVSVQHVSRFTDGRGTCLYYVVSLDPAGFVIVAGDDLVEPIIGFAPDGEFDASAGNPLRALANGDLVARIGHAQQVAVAPDAAAAQAQAKWRQLGAQDGGPVATPLRVTAVSEVRVAPFTRTTWSQRTAADAGAAACYNYYTPPYGDGSVNNYPAGCVATAMAQILRYYQFPITGVGAAGFTIYRDGGAQTYYLHGGDAFGGPYQWSNMPLIPPATPTPAQCQAIGALVADAGATVGMSYRASGSSSAVPMAKDAFVNNFHFASAIKAYDDSSGVGGLVGMLNPNLDARLPVLLGISGPGGGHAVVADGYGYESATLYHHLNLGWSGMDNAWYALPIIDTSSYYFSSVDSCIYNLYTNGTGEIISGRVLDQIGRPVANAVVTALHGGSTYTATTDSQGIYALTRLPSASTYAIAVTKDNSSTATNTFSTGTSSDFGPNSGNYWGADFTWTMSPAALDHLSWSTIAATQTLSAPFAVTVTARNLTNGVATGYNGSVGLSAYATAFGPPATIIGARSWNMSLSGSEMTHGYAFTPNTNLQVTAVRGYNTDKVSIWTDSGTLLTSQAVSASGSWVEAALPAPITLAAGTTYRVAAHIPAGWPGYFTTWAWPTAFANGTVGQTFYSSYGDIFPTAAYGTSQGPLVDLRYYVVSSNAIPVSPASSGAFASGIWNGNVTLGAAATNIVLKADDGAGHTAASNPFAVVDPNAAPPVIVTQPQSRTNSIGDNATFTMVATSGSTPSYSWRRGGSPISGASGSSYTLNNVQLSDSGSQFACVVNNNYGAVTSQTAVLTVICTNITVAAQPAVTLNPGAIVCAVAPLADGSVIFGGYFSNVNGVARARLARLQPSGALDTTWNPAPNGWVLALAASGSSLYVGGSFTSIGGYTRKYIAKLSTAGTGAADPSWNPNAEYYVETLALNGSDLYAGGDFAYIGGQNRSCIAKLSTTGTGVADATWNPNATIAGDYPAVYGLAFSDGSVYAGGYFTAIGGQTRYAIAKLSATGTGAADATWNPNANSSVYAVCVNGADVYAGGAFNQIGSQSRSGIARLSNAGTGLADTTWNPGADSSVESLVVNGLCVYAGGSFTSIGGCRRVGLAKLSALGTGAADNAWAADCDGEVRAVVSAGSALYVGGAFTQLAGQSRPGIAALNYTVPQLLAAWRPAANQFQFTLTGERGQGFDILASTNSLNWDTLATLTNTTGTTNFLDTNATLKQRFYRARQLP